MYSMHNAVEFVGYPLARVRAREDQRRGEDPKLRNWIPRRKLDSTRSTKVNFHLYSSFFTVLRHGASPALCRGRPVARRRLVPGASARANRGSA